MADEVPLPNNTTAHSLPSTPNPLSPISQDTTLAFAMPYGEAATFLDTVQELPNKAIFHPENNPENTHNSKLWVIKATKNNGQASPSTLRGWASNAWTNFLDLLKVRQALWFWIFLLTKTFTERGITGYYYHGPWLSSHASDVCRCSCQCDAWGRISGSQHLF